MKAVIVAAGMSTRMFPLKEARGIPKCLLPVNGIPLIKRAVDQLHWGGIPSVGVVVGYKQDKIRACLGNTVTYILNPFYEYSNNMASLWFAKNFIGNDDFIYLHSDLIFDTEILEILIDKYYCNTIVVDRKECDEEAMKVILNKDGKLLESNKSIPLEKSNGEWIGLARFTDGTIFEYCEKLLKDKEYLYDYDTSAFSIMTKTYPIGSYSISGSKWMEIDYPEEYFIASRQDWK